jgi:hypothetical protein
MKIACPKCAFVIDAGDVPDTLLSVIGDGILSVRCPGCASEIELAPLTATLHFAGSSSTWRGMLVRTEAQSTTPAAAR